MRHHRRRVTFFDPATHAQALAYHVGQERAAKMQPPILPTAAVEPMLERLEAEIIMQGVPHHAAA